MNTQNIIERLTAIRDEMMDAIANPSDRSRRRRGVFEIDRLTVELRADLGEPDPAPVLGFLKEPQRKLDAAKADPKARKLTETPA
jgi:hypothetical protein